MESQIPGLITINIGRLFLSYYFNYRVLTIGIAVNLKISNTPHSGRGVACNAPTTR